MVIEGENLVTSVKSTGMGIMELATIFSNLKPDAVLTIADRYETIATAIAGAYSNIPVIHVQGGEVTGSIDEKVRHAVTKLADIHLVANEHAAQRVRRLGEEPDTIVVTGCPSIDLVANVLASEAKPCSDFINSGVGADIEVGKDYQIVMQHPVTYEWQNAEVQIGETLAAVVKTGRPTFWFWPNVDAGSDAASRAIRKFREHHKVENIRFLKNMPPEDFLQLLRSAKCLIGNSSTGIRETAFMGMPVVNIGSRQSGRERAENVLDVGYDRHEIFDAIEKQVAVGRYESNHLYGDGAAGDKIATCLAEIPLRTEKRIVY